MRKLLPIIFFALLTACTSVCRHQVMADYAEAVEGHRPCRIIVYEISPVWSMGVYAGHAELECDDEPFLPAYPMVGRVARFSGEDWLAALRSGQFKYLSFP